MMTFKCRCRHKGCMCQHDIEIPLEEQNRAILARLIGGYLESEMRSESVCTECEADMHILTYDGKRTKA